MKQVNLSSGSILKLLKYLRFVVENDRAKDFMCDSNGDYWMDKDGLEIRIQFDKSDDESGQIRITNTDYFAVLDKDTINDIGRYYESHRIFSYLRSSLQRCVNEYAHSLSDDIDKISENIKTPV